MKKILRFSSWISLTFVASALLSIPCYASETPSVGSLGIRIAQIPAAVADQPYSDVYIVSRVQPSTSLIQRLEVFNTSAQEFKVNLYPGAATFVDGKFAVAAGNSDNTLTRRTRLSPTSLVVKPGESKTFLMTIDTPSKAASEQEFGVIWAEVQSSPNSSGVKTSSRVGIRMYIPVGDSPQITISPQNVALGSDRIMIEETKRTYLNPFYITSLVINLLLLSLFLFCCRRKSKSQKEEERNVISNDVGWSSETERLNQISKRTGR